jgi:non-ribosomal peptide synthetase component F
MIDGFAACGAFNSACSASCSGDGVMKDQGARSAMRTPLTFVTWTAADCERAIPDHFADQVTKTPDAIAVALPAGDITYTQLDIASDSAARLVCKAVGADSRPVALLCQQGYESIVWTLGVL